VASPICTVCGSPARERVDVEIVSGETLAAIGRRYKLSQDALTRHKSAHLSPAITKLSLEKLGVESARGAMVIYEERMEAMLSRLERALDGAESRNSYLALANLVREWRSLLELMAKITGVLDERPQVAVNILASPELGELIGVLLKALDPFPEARIAAAAALDVGEVIDV
jgi:hypothetical protein